jgi:hypothetical protein
MFFGWMVELRGALQPSLRRRGSALFSDQPWFDSRSVGNAMMSARGCASPADDPRRSRAQTSPVPFNRWQLSDATLCAVAK